MLYPAEEIASIASFIRKEMQIGAESTRRFDALPSTVGAAVER